MPKQVDHEARRTEIAEALFRIAGTRGLEGASLRDVAAEAGISLGRLQHYFRTRDEMLLFALERMNHLAEAGIRKRIESLGREPTPHEVLRESLLGMLPLDERSRTGYLVGVAYFVRAVHDESLGAHARAGIPNLRAFFADQLRRAQDRGEVAAGRDPESEAMRLICLVEGLSSYVVLDVQGAQDAVRLLDGQLAELFTAPPPSCRDGRSPRAGAPVPS
ncbi:TetR/AcrR family transcriptional regulator [Streptomyces sp. NPDC059740]|uniref:TetR/AcrR family transcriptional regulator n=1 Tax=Streptomyces sp. NPDC059740 TaxID=3346926 RepID=UPI0036532D61